MQPTGADTSTRAASGSEFFTIHLSGLPAGTSDKALHDWISGNRISVRSVHIPKDKTFAKVNFYVEAEAENAISTLNGKQFNGSSVHAVRELRRDQLVKEANLFVKDVPLSADEAAFREKFAEFGPIVSVKLETFKDGKSRGYGYVQYEKKEDA